MKNTVLVLTPGDPDGIGPEITWKMIQSGILKKNQVRLLCVGAAAPFEKLKAPIQKITPSQLGTPHGSSDSANSICLLAAPTQAPQGRLLAGFQAGWSIKKATELVLAHQAQALVTGPISKERLQKGGFNFPGHTEFLARLCGIKTVTMMLANEQLRVSLVTTHLALKDISKAITRKKIRLTVQQTFAALKDFWGTTCPKIAVAALNPHAGEGGRFGTEEIKMITPEIRALQTKYGDSMRLTGPLSADTLFANHIATPEKKRFDAVICLYHDQGLIPVKLLDFHQTVNVTLGLPMIRTSVDHGVGFDIAGKGIANPSSLCAAVKLAAQLVQRKRTQRKTK